MDGAKIMTKRMIDCSKTKNYFLEKKRMIKKHEYVCNLNCGDCPLNWSKNGKDVSCEILERSYPEQAISIVQRWSNANPQKTYLTELFDKYPNAQLHVTGILTGIPKDICPYHLGLMSIDDCPKKDRNCVKCWNQPIEGGEE